MKLAGQRINQNFLQVLISLVWLINGLFCKVLNLVPRHQQIVARILGEEYSFLITRAIGVLEILMAVWVLSRIQSKFCTAAQVFLVAVMNILEYFLAPDLLLFGRMNLVVAFMFISVLISSEMIYNSRKASTKFSH